MENPETLAEDRPPAAKPPYPPTPKPHRRKADPPMSAEPTLSGSRRRRGARVSADPVREPLAVGSDRAGGAGRNSFRAGDLVWGKLKIHSWWPGKVLDPSEERPAKASRRGEVESVLVASFGDDTVAWFEPSQLKPFEEELRQMLKQSSSGSFVKAVKDALMETEKRLGLEMSCNCSSDFKGAQGVGKGSVTNYAPAQFHDRLLDAARDVSGIDMLEVMLLSCWASALRRGSRCPTDVIEKDCPDATLHGQPVDEPGAECEVSFSTVLKGPGVSEASKQRRKERSIAELIADKGSEIAEPRGCTLKVNTFDQLRPPSSSEFQKQKKKGEKRKSSEVQNGIVGVQEEKRTIELDNAEPSSLEGKDDKSSNAKNDGVSAELETRTSGRERKRSKYLSPPYTYMIGYSKRSVLLIIGEAEKPNKDSEASQPSIIGSTQNLENINQVLKDEDDKAGTVSDGDGSSIKRILSMFLSASVDAMYLKQKRSANAVRDLFGKYRSFNYSNGSDFLNYQKFLKDLASKGEWPIVNYMNNSSEKDNAAGKSNKGLNPVSDEARIDQGHDTSILNESDRVEKRRKMRHDKVGTEISVAIENSSANCVKENYPQEKEMREGSGGGAKNKVDLHHELINNAKGGKSTRRTKHMDAADAETQSDAVTGLADHSEPNILGRKRKKGDSAGNPETASEVEPKPASAYKRDRSKLKRKKKEETNHQNPASLLLRFAPGSALPSKGDIISTFGIYGPLVESDTEILQGCHCIHVVFERGTDAEKALKSLDNCGSLASSIVNCELHHPGSLISQLQTSPVSETPLPYIKKSLERMISKLTRFMQAEKDVEYSKSLRPEITNNLVNEMDGLLKKVNKLLTGTSVST